MITPSDEVQLRNKLRELHEEHRDLDNMVNRLVLDTSADQLQLTRLKKRKLFVKDQIQRIKSQIIPNRPA